MSWCIEEQLIRGEIYNTVRGRVTGRLWFHGLAGPVVLNLRGDCAPDLAGCVLVFENTMPPVAGDLAGFRPEQNGWVGSITASQKCNVHDVPMEEVMRLYALKQPAPDTGQTRFISNGIVSCEAATREYIQWMEENLSPRQRRQRRRVEAEQGMIATP